MNGSNDTDLKQGFDLAKDDEKLRQFWRHLDAIKAGNERIAAGLKVANDCNRAMHENFAEFERQEQEPKQQTEIHTHPVQKKSFADFFWSWLKLMAIYLILSSIVLSLAAIDDNADVPGRVQIKRQLQASGIYQEGGH